MKKSKTFRFYFALIFGILIILFCCIISVVSYQISSRQVKSKIGSNLAESAYIIADTLDAQFYSNLGKLNLLKEFDIIKEGTDNNQINKVLDSLKINFDGFSWIGYASSDGVILAATDSLGIGSDVSSYPFYQYGLRSRYISDEEENYIFAQNIFSNTGFYSKFITLSVPVYSSDDKITGVICAYVNWDWVNDFIDSFVMSFKSNTNLDILIVSSKNNVIYGSEPLVGTIIKSESIKKSRYHLNSWLIETFDDNIKYLTGYTRSDGYADYNGLGWTILVRQPFDSAFSSTYTLLYIILFVSVIFTVLFSAVGWYFAGLLIKPLEKIAIAANDIRLGKQSEIPFYHGIRDIEILSLSLTHLITSLTNTESSLATMKTRAFQDTLTNLPNRSGFDNYISSSFGRLNNHHETLTLLFLDLDGFKGVNDTYGHPSGDLLLIEVANRLKSCVRTNEFVARFGGDEFAIIIQTSKQDYLDQISTVCNRILEALNIPFNLNGNYAEIGCSIGCATWPIDSTSVEELLSFADEALYNAKRTGKNQYVLYNK